MTTFLHALSWISILFLVIMLFNLVIVVHEWGHFLAARWRGLKIDKFQIWFGKPIWKKTINGVQYGLGTIPFGGFVALPQMASMETIEGKADGEGGENKPLPPISPLDKIIVAFAGPLFSFLLAIVFAFIVWGVGKPEMQAEEEAILGFVDADLPAGQPNGLKVRDRVIAIDGEPVDRFAGPQHSVMWGIVSAREDNIVFDVTRDGSPLKITINAPTATDPEFIAWQSTPWYKKLVNRPPLRRVGIWYATENIGVVGTVPNSPAALAGFQKDDLVRKLNGERFLATQNIRKAIEKSSQTPLQFEVERDGRPLLISVTPVKPSKPSDYAGKGEIGLMLHDADEEKRLKDRSNIKHPDPYDQISGILKGTVSTFQNLISPKSSIGPGHMSSALGIMTVYHRLLVIPNGWMLVLAFTVTLNVGLAFMNMLPIPVLDGGHITMALIEAATKRPIRGRIIEYMQAGCALMLFSFMIWVMLKDIGGWFDKDAEPIEFDPPPAAVTTR